MAPHGGLPFVDAALKEDEEPDPTEEEIMKDYDELKLRAKDLIKEWMDYYLTRLGIPVHSLDSTTPEIRLSLIRSRSATVKGSSSGAMGADSSHMSVYRGNNLKFGRKRISKSTKGKREHRAKDKIDAWKEQQSQSEEFIVFQDGNYTSVQKLTQAVLPTESLVNAMIQEQDTPHTASWEDPHAHYKLMSSISQTCVASVTDVRILHCPPSLREHLLGNYTLGCRCRRTQIPRITDVEFDSFIRKYSPKTQLVVVGIKSSRYPDQLQNPLMLERLYEHQCEGRTYPCVTCVNDHARYVWYDVDVAHVDTGHATPLLQMRHHVVPGMFLIYCNGELIFCDYIFNGYGTEQEDFMKQVASCRVAAREKKYLPFDFKFKLIRGHHGMRSSWGGEIGGVYYKITDGVLELRGSTSSVQFQIPRPLKTLPPIRADTRKKEERKRSEPHKPVCIDYPPDYRAIIHSGRNIIGYIRPITAIPRLHDNHDHDQDNMMSGGRTYRDSFDGRYGSISMAL